MKDNSLKVISDSEHNCHQNNRINGQIQFYKQNQRVEAVQRRALK